MKQIIKRVLEEISTSQVNLTSAAARETVSSLISAALKVQGYNNKNKVNSYLTTDLSEEEQKARETWVCSICGENTYDVDYEYIGSCTNHLGCELELELEEPVRTEDGEYVEEGIRREKNYSQKKHEDKVFGHDQGGSYEKKVWPGSDAIQKQLYNEMTSDGLPEGGDAQAVLESHKLADEIVDNKDGKWIYESPDGGKTVFRRPFSDYDPKNKEEIDWETKEPTGRKFNEYPFKENVDIQIDGC